MFKQLVAATAPDSNSSPGPWAATSQSLTSATFFFCTAKSSDAFGVQF